MARGFVNYYAFVRMFIHVFPDLQLISKQIDSA